MHGLLAKEMEEIIVWELALLSQSLTWRLEKFGLYSVHSGYYFLINSSPELAEGSDQQSANKNKKLDVEVSCVLCGRETKTNEHLNNKVHDHSSQSIKDIASFVLSYVHDFGTSQRGSAHVHNSSNDRWNLPDENHVKINSDASFNAA
ncbi:hypothetical protein V6N13_072837 [Hibiscus sabdariffa]